MCWLLGDVMSVSSVSPAEQLPLRQHKPFTHFPSHSLHKHLLMGNCLPSRFQGSMNAKNKLIRGNGCTLNLDLPTVELFVQRFHTEVVRGNSLHRKSLKKGSGLNQRLGQLPEQKEPAQVMSGLFQKSPIPVGLH